MRLLLCFLLLCGQAMAAPKFVVTKWNPAKPIKSSVSVVAPAADCGCAADSSKCDCERGNCRCTTCKCEKCGEPAVEISPQMQAKMTALETDGVWWDENYFVEAKKPIYGAIPERRKIHVYAPSWCTACQKTKEALGGGDEDLEVVYHTDSRGVQGAKYYPAYWDAGKRQFYYNVRLDADGAATRTPWINNDLEALKNEMGITDPITGAIPAGEIKRELVERILPFLGWFHGAGLKGDARDIPLGPVTLGLPANFGVDWNTTTGLTKFVPTEAPAIKWGILLNKKINFVTYNGDQIEFDVPKIPNPVLKIIGPKTVNSTLPEMPPTALPSRPIVLDSLDGVISQFDRPQAKKRTATAYWTHPGNTRSELINHLMLG